MAYQLRAEGDVRERRRLPLRARLERADEVQVPLRRHPVQLHFFCRVYVFDRGADPVPRHGGLDADAVVARRERLLDFVFGLDAVAAVVLRRERVRGGPGAGGWGRGGAGRAGAYGRTSTAGSCASAWTCASREAGAGCVEAQSASELAPPHWQRSFLKKDDEPSGW